MYHRGCGSQESKREELHGAKVKRCSHEGCSSTKPKKNEFVPSKVKRYSFKGCNKRVHEGEAFASPWRKGKKGGFVIVDIAQKVKSSISPSSSNRTLQTNSVVSAISSC